MQLSPRTRRRTWLATGVAALVAGSGLPAAADSGVTATTTFFHESGGPLNMTVLTPGARASADLADAVTIQADYEADIVSGASVAVVDAPTGDVDAIASATKLDDVRHTAGGGLTLRGETTSLSASYRYGIESDYRSHGLALSARAEMFERNTAFEISYARGWDKVCNLEQPRAQEAVDRQRLPSSDGCFEPGDRESLPLSIQTFQGSWTQAWTPILTTQLTLTAQLLHGYQGNPYRAVWLGRTAAQEHHPEDRARYAVGLGARLWLEPLSGALQIQGRAYRDTWDIESLTAELAYEQTITYGLRLRARGRYYTQTGAIFYSDDYAFEPAGQYFTGDRELSPMSSVTLGGQVAWSVPPGEDGSVLGFIQTFDLVGKADFIMHSFDDFQYGRAEVPNTDAIIATVGFEALF